MINSETIWTIKKPLIIDTIKRLTEATSKLQMGDSNGESKLSYEIIDGIAVIDINGIIIDKSNALYEAYGFIGAEQVRLTVQKAIEDQLVSGILLNINSPGGTVTGVPELSDYLVSARKIKPILTFSDSMIASAAYWIAASTTGIYSTKSAEIGSIGVYVALTDTSKIYENMGVKVELFKAGKFKAAGIEGVQLTDEQRSEIQSGVDYIYNLFTSAVVQNRGPIAEETMQGQTFYGLQAKGVNLVDSVVSDESQAIKDLKILSGNR